MLFKNILQRSAILGVSLLPFIVIRGTDAISCFQCNSGVDPGCATIKTNDTRSIYYKPCLRDESAKGKTMFCRKIHQEIKDVKHTNRIIRKCGWESSPNKDCYKFEDDDHKEIVCQCFSDACNSADSLIANRSSVYFFTVLTAMVMWCHRQF